MKIIFAISIVLVLAILLFFYQPFQGSDNEAGQDDSQAAAVKAQPAQGSQAQSDRSGTHSFQQQRQSMMAIREMEPNRSGYAQKSTQGTNRYQSNAQQSKRFSEANLQSSQPLPGTKPRSYPGAQGQYSSSPGYAAPSPTRNTYQGQAAPFQKSNVTGPGQAYNAYAMNQRPQVTTQRSQQKNGSSAASGYNSKPGSQVQYPVSQNTRANSMQSPGMTKSQQYRSQAANQAQQYQKASETVDCTYKDDKVTCR